MKICFWIGNAYYRKAGTNRIVCTIANELVKNHDVSILVTVNEHLNNAFEYDNRIKIEKLEDANAIYQQPLDRKHLKIRDQNNKTGYYNQPERYETLVEAFFSETYQKPLKVFFEKKKYDVIIASGMEILWLAVMADTLKVNSKLIGWQHSNYSSYVERENILFWKKEELLKRYIPKLDKLIVLNPYDKEAYLQELGLQVDFIENPLTIKSEIKTDPNNKHFIFVGRLVPDKGLELLVDSFASFCTHNDDWELIIVGDGRLRSRFIRQVWKCGIQARVRFVGFKRDVIKYYLESSVFLMPSRYEGWGLVVTEAMQLGLPVISYDITPMEYIIDHAENGLIVGKFNTKRFAAAMLKLANDDEMRFRMSIAAIKKSEQFSLEVIMNKWLELFTEGAC